MIVFDASGSMTGMGFGENTVTRIQQVRRALATVLPAVAPVRNLGLVVFGPGARSQCHNIDLRLPPGPNSARRIMGEVNTLQPYGQTPLTSAVAAAADALDFRDRPAVIVLLRRDLPRRPLRARPGTQDDGRRRDRARYRLHAERHECAGKRSVRTLFVGNDGRDVHLDRDDRRAHRGPTEDARLPSSVFAAQAQACGRSHYREMTGEARRHARALRR